jgi:hypothetical protein
MSSMVAMRSVRFGVRSRKLSNVGPKIYYFELLRASEGTLSRWSRLHLHPPTLTNLTNRVVGYHPLSLCVNHKEDGDSAF